MRINHLHKFFIQIGKGLSNESPSQKANESSLQRRDSLALGKLNKMNVRGKINGPLQIFYSSRNYIFVSNYNKKDIVTNNLFIIIRNGGLLNWQQLFMPIHKPAYIDLCNRCMQACEECLTSCLNEPDVHTLVHCIHMLQDCAEICSIASRYMSRNSTHAKQGL
jgi:hypothetical protein